MSWAAAELKTAKLGDKRRNQRLIKIVEDLASKPSSSIPQAFDNSKFKIQKLENYEA